MLLAFIVVRRLGCVAIVGYAKRETTLSIVTSRMHNDNRMLTTAEVMALLGYRCPKAFWNLVYTQRVPHVRLNARVIRFPSAGLRDWLQRRSSSS